MRGGGGKCNGCEPEKETYGTYNLARIVDDSDRLRKGHDDISEFTCSASSPSK